MSTASVWHPPVRRAVAWVARDWRSGRYLTWGGLILALTSLVTIFYCANVPHPALDPDTPAYLNQTRRILASGNFASPARLPGYPTFIAALFLLTGRGSLDAVSVAQAVLYVLATLEIYAALCLVARRSWVAALIVAPVAVNPYLLSYVRPILAEGLALFLVATLALALVIFLRWPGARSLWGVMLALLALFLTRPEWIYLPLPLSAFLLIAAARRGRLLRLLPSAIMTLAVLYGTLGGYVMLNRTRNLCTCVTYIPNVNLLGKVMQYRMEDEAPARYGAVTQLVAAHLARGDTDPWNVLRDDYPPLRHNYFALAGEYSLAIIGGHPVEFVAKSSQVTAYVLTETTPFRPIDPHGPFAAPLFTINAGSAALMRAVLPLFLFVGVGWLLWMLWRRRKPSLLADAMGLFALVGGYGVALTVFGDYVYYARLRAPYTALLLTVVWGSAVLAALWLGGRALTWYRGRREDIAQHPLARNNLAMWRGEVHGRYPEI